MSTWRRTIQSLAEALAIRPSIPRGLVQLLVAVERAELSEIVGALDSGELAQIIQGLDEVSLQLGVEFASELRIQFEEAGAFEEASAIDHVADRRHEVDFGTYQ